MRTRAIVVSLGLLAALTACTTNSPAAEPAPTAAPTPTATITFAPVTVPTDCVTLVDENTYATVFAETPLNDPGLGYAETLGAVSPTAPAADAGVDDVVDAATQLRCVWRFPEADITYLQVCIGSVAAAVGDDYRAALQLDGYTCDDTLEGTRCAVTGIDPQYQTDTADTVFLRDDLVIRIDQANFPTNDLLGAIVAQIWAA